MVVALLGVMTSCEETEDSEAITITIGSGAIETADVGDTISFDVSIVAEAKLETFEIRKGTATLETISDFANPESDVYEFSYTVMAEDADKTLEFAFIVTDKKANEQTENYSVTINPIENPLSFENTGSILGNKIGPDQSAWNLVDNVREAGSATSDMQNPSISTGTTEEQWIKGWDAETSTRFVKSNDYNYEAASAESAATAYSNGTATDEVRNIEVGDIYIAKLRESNEYAVIKIVSIDDLITSGSHIEEIEFDYKKSSESAGS
jgi:hypothetical protein